jgi:anti-sigma factor RsiW
MDYEAQLKLQAFLDGELPEAEAREVANWVARDREATALQAELRHTRQALAGHESGIRVPESREFYWSKIRREIERLETPAVQPARLSLYARLRWFLWPAGALALVLAAGLFVSLRNGGTSAAELAMDTEQAAADTGAFTYRDYAAGATLIWLSYPADQDLATKKPGNTLNL